jgi:hypothetical protein
MLNPWFAPLMLSSASTIALRTLMMVPEGGRFSPWQQREALRMVDEKMAAVRESHALAVELAVQAWTTPWLFWGPLGEAPLRRMGEGTAAVVGPFSRRAESNARRLGARAARPMLAAVPALAAAGVAGELPVAKVIPLFAAAPAVRRRRRT